MDRFLNNNLVLRIVAVVLACILWFTVNAPQPVTPSTQSGVTAKDFPYSVHVEVNQDMMVTQIDHPTVVIEIRSALGNTTALPSEMMGVQVVADARGLAAGTRTVKLKALNMPAVQYTIMPPSIQVTLEQKVTSSKPIHIHVTGSPAKGYQLGSVQTDIEDVQVSGVSSAVKRVAAVTADISVAGAKSAVSHTLTLEPVDSSGRSVPGVEVDPVNVTAVVKIEPPQVAIHLAPEVVGTPAPGYAVSGVSLAQNSVNITASPDVTSNLSSVNLPVDVSGLRSTQTLTVPIVPEAGWTRVTPTSVPVTVTVTKSASRTFAKVPIQIANEPQNLSVTLGKVKNLDVRVSGPAPVISKLRTSDIVAYIDASNLSTGDKSALLTVSVPNWVTVTQLSQSTVPVSVTTAGANSTTANTTSANQTGASTAPTSTNTTASANSASSTNLISSGNQTG